VSIRSPVLYVKEILVTHCSLSGNRCISFANPADLSGPKKRAYSCPPLAFSREPCLGVDGSTYGSSEEQYRMATAILRRPANRSLMRPKTVTKKYRLMFAMPAPAMGSFQELHP